MKKSSDPKPGNKGKQINNLKTKAPEMHDNPLRRQPPTPQDIARVQPVSQSTGNSRPDDPQHGTKARKGPK